MRILLDLLHPAHVHFFAPFHREMTARGHELRVASRRKDVTTQLLQAKGIPHEPISTRRGGPAGLWSEALARFRRLDRIVRDFRPHVITGCMGPVAALVGKRRGIPSVIFYNNETAIAANRVAQRFATAYVTGASFARPGGPRHVVHDWFQELAYLHPARFRPDPGTRSALGLADGERLIVARFVSLTSSHDRGVRGIRDRPAFLAALAAHGRVFLSTEEPWRPGGPAEPVPAPDRMHDLLAAADLVVGESATVAAEAAVLGVPSIYAADSPRGYLDDLETRFGLVHQEAGDEPALARARALLEDPEARAHARAACDRMLLETPDPVPWMVAFFEEAAWR